MSDNDLQSSPASICPAFARDAATPVPTGTPSEPSNLARLLGELAALPPDQRQALAALLSSMPSTPAPAPTDLPGDRCKLDDAKRA